MGGQGVEEAFSAEQGGTYIEIFRMMDCSGQEVVPVAKKLTICISHHPNCDGAAWDWIEGCTKNVIWSDSCIWFDYKRATDFVRDYNETQGKPVKETEHPVLCCRDGLYCKSGAFGFCKGCEWDVQRYSHFCHCWVSHEWSDIDNTTNR